MCAGHCESPPVGLGTCLVDCRGSQVLSADPGIRCPLPAIDSLQRGWAGGRSVDHGRRMTLWHAQERKVRRDPDHHHRFPSVASDNGPRVGSTHHDVPRYTFAVRCKTAACSSHRGREDLHAWSSSSQHCIDLSGQCPASSLCLGLSSSCCRLQWSRAGSRTMHAKIFTDA
jgi:hypothetical protein